MIHEPVKDQHLGQGLNPGFMKGHDPLNEGLTKGTGQGFMTSDPINQGFTKGTEHEGFMARHDPLKDGLMKGTGHEGFTAGRNPITQGLTTGHKPIIGGLANEGVTVHHMGEGLTGHHMGEGLTGQHHMGQGLTGHHMGEGLTGHHMGEGLTGHHHMGEGLTGQHHMGQGLTGHHMGEGLTGHHMGEGLTGHHHMGEGLTGHHMGEGLTGHHHMGEGLTGHHHMGEGLTGHHHMGEGLTGHHHMGAGSGLALRPEPTVKEKIVNAAHDVKNLVTGAAGTLGEHALRPGEERRDADFTDHAKGLHRHDAMDDAPSYCDHHHCYEHTPCSVHGVTSTTADRPEGIKDKAKHVKDAISAKITGKAHRTDVHGKDHLPQE